VADRSNCVNRKDGRTHRSGIAELALMGAGTDEPVIARGPAQSA
jgi:hypothetical protein